MEWLLYYHHNFQVVIKPKVEKRVRELGVEVVLRIKGEEIRVSRNPKNRELRMAGEEQGMGAFRQEHAVKVCSFYPLLITTDSLQSAEPQTKIKRPLNHGRKNAPTNHKPGKEGEFRGVMTLGQPYTLAEDVSIALYLETHPPTNWTRDKYWQDFIDWVTFSVMDLCTPILTASPVSPSK